MNKIEAKDIQNRIRELEKEILKARNELVELRRRRSGEKITDYLFDGIDGLKIRLSELFGAHRELIVVHNMGQGCNYCTMWADGFNGVLDHIESRAAFVLVSPDDPETQRRFAESRDWRFKMISGKGTSFSKDMGYEIGGSRHMPGFSTFYKDGKGDIYRAANDYFGPGDPFCSVWHLFDLLPNGADGWQPKLRY